MFSKLTPEIPKSSQPVSKPLLRPKIIKFNDLMILKFKNISILWIFQDSSSSTIWPSTTVTLSLSVAKQFISWNSYHKIFI